MERMAACAASCTQLEAEHRKTMTMVVHVLEGEIDVTALNPSSQRKNTFTYEELEQATDKFLGKNIIGKGGFAQVYIGLLKDGRVVAVKQLMAVGEEAEKEFRNEIEMIGGLHPHKHVVSLIGHCITPKKRILVYEFVPNGSLHSHLYGEKKPIIDWSTRMRIAIGSARGIAYLHHECNPTIIHRDIKSLNILLDENFEAKIADFGLSKWKNEDQTHVSTRVAGTPGYLARDYALTGHVTDKSDIYSFGAVIIELITGRQPGAIGGRSKNELFIDWIIPFLSRSLKDQNYDAIADPRLNGIYDHNEMARMAACAASCIQPNAKRRPTMSLIVLILEGEVPVDVLKLDTSISSSESHDSIQQPPRNSRYTGRRHTSTETEYSETTTESKYSAGLILEVHREEESPLSKFDN